MLARLGEFVEIVMMAIRQGFMKYFIRAFSMELVEISNENFRKRLT
jgi:hypothetical protein